MYPFLPPNLPNSDHACSWPSDMDRTYTSLLDSWAKDDAVKAVLIQGSTPRAFCSGAYPPHASFGGMQFHASANIY